MSARSHVVNRRHVRRFRAQHPAKIVLGPDAMISCMVEDISPSGARISLRGDIPLPDDFDLFIAAHALQVHRAHLCWRHDGYAGVSFIQCADQTEQTRSLGSDGAERNDIPDCDFERVLIEVEREDPAHGRSSLRLRK